MRITAILLFFTSLLSAQVTDRTIYLDSTFAETTEGNHMYYRIVNNYNKTQPTYKITDYYKSGKIQGEGYSTNKNYLRETGLQIKYYENGNKKTTSLYEDDIQVGPYNSWYEDGNLEIEGEYYYTGKEKQNSTIKTTGLKINQFWNQQKKQTVKNGNGYCEIYHKDGCDEGKIKNGLKDSLWSGHDRIYKYTYVEKYNNGEFSVGISTDETAMRRIYRIVDEKPEFQGGMDEFYRYVMRNFQTPETPGLNGKVFVGFYIEKDGEVDGIKIIRSLGEAVDKETYRILSLCPPWKPGKKRGINVRALYSLPINITTAN